MEHLLKKSKCSIFHNIFKNMIFQRRQKALLWSKGLNASACAEVQKFWYESPSGFVFGPCFVVQ